MYRVMTCAAGLCLLPLCVLIGCSSDDPATPGSDPGGYKLIKHLVSTEDACGIVNIMFQVLERGGAGADDLVTGDFVVKEDGGSVSPTESAMTISKYDEIPYRLRAVLLIDNSASVGVNLAQIKAAASDVVDAKLASTEMAIIVFSEFVQVISEFTADPALLNQAIDSITDGAASTNLYGAIVTGVAQWDDLYSLTQVDQGFMIAITDGSDTQGSETLANALTARGDKKVFMIGVGDEIEPDVLDDLGNQGYYELDDFSQLSAQLAEIQGGMQQWANSFYWLSYRSPKRGDFDHTLSLTIADNPNTGSGRRLEGDFSSTFFFTCYPGDGIVGSWRLQMLCVPDKEYLFFTGDNYEMYHVNAGGSGTFEVYDDGVVNESEDFTWTLDGDELTLEYDTVTDQFEVIFNANRSQVIMRRGDSACDQDYYFIRVE